MKDMGLTVVNHLDIVSSAFFADPIATWLTVNLSGSSLENFLDMRPCRRIPTRHE